MSSISTYKRQLKRANRALANDQQRQVEIKKMIEELQEEYAAVGERIEEDRRNVVTKGMLYFNSSKREQLLEDAENLNYSKTTIERLRALGNAEWNADNVDEDIISAFESVEDYVNDNKPDWEKSIPATIGKFFLSKCEKL